ncbi:MAG: glucosamine-6-phosphate deaminase [Candidatus Obscuribacterales bacterium]|nr:glucosamine-6-phosphate deaminase [Candidatus Obscuribacterales bacterium]
MMMQLQIERPKAEAYREFSKIVAAVVADLIKEKPNAALGLPTGRTPTVLYEYLAEHSRNGLDWSNVRCFGLDEYVDANEQHSFRRFLEEHVYQHANVNKKNLFNPLLIDNYDLAIAEQGGLDLAILGLGRNGHIAFNEPGTPMQSWTHSVWLSESTQHANAEFFDGGRIPTRAVTMGISTLLAAKRLILMVTGTQKKEILERAMRGPITSEVPASFLQTHDNLMVLADFDY